MLRLKSSTRLAKGNPLKLAMIGLAALFLCPATPPAQLSQLLVCRVQVVNRGFTEVTRDEASVGFCLAELRMLVNSATRKWGLWLETCLTCRIMRTSTEDDTAKS